MNDIRKINHIAVVVEDLENALIFWRDQLGLEMEKIEHVDGMEVRIAFLPVGESKIELVQPTSSDSGVARFLRKRGPGLHHICLEVDDIQKKLGELSGQGVRLINQKPIRMEDGRQLAFVHPAGTGGVLLELYQLPR